MCVNEVIHCNFELNLNQGFFLAFVCVKNFCVLTQVSKTGGAIF